MVGADARRRMGHQKTHLLCHPASLTSPTLRSAPRIVSFGWASGLTTRWAAQRVRNRRTCVKKWQAHLEIATLETENSLPVQTRPHMLTWRRSRSVRPLSISTTMGHPVLILPHITCAAAPSLRADLRLPLLSRPTMPGTNSTACAAEADMLSKHPCARRGAPSSVGGLASCRVVVLGI